MSPKEPYALVAVYGVTGVAFENIHYQGAISLTSLV